jgi:hypothetical protein
MIIGVVEDDRRESAPGLLRRTRWKKRCYPCWREHKALPSPWEASELRRLRGEVARLRDRLEVLEGAEDFLGGLKYYLAFLIFVAHPDRNNSDSRANEATRWLLEVREWFKMRDGGEG